MALNSFDCDFCGATFKLEKNYKKHFCEKMNRALEMRKRTGKSAFMYYSEWMNFKGRIKPTTQTFIDSRYYNAFIKYVDFANRMAIPDPIDYIKYMVSKTMEPFLWYKHEVYAHYLESFDKIYDAMTQASMTVETIIQLSRIFECDVSEVIPELESQEMMKLIRAKKLSPWILLLSSTFMTFLQNNTTSHERIRIQDIINPDKWAKIFKRNPKSVKQMKIIIKELGI